MTTTNRTVVSGLEGLLGKKIPVLDHGYIIPIDYMGSDLDICRSARISTGSDDKDDAKNEALIRYLYRMMHRSPFEMCLSGDTLIPTAPCKGAKVKYYSLKEIATAFKGMDRKDSWVKLLKIRTVDPETGVVSRTKIKKAWSNGIKPVFRITTEHGRSIKATGNHPFLMPDGSFKTVDQLSIADSVCLNGVPATPMLVVKEVCKLRKSGESITTIAELTGVTYTTVYNILVKKKLYRRMVHRPRGHYKLKGDHKDPRAIARRKVPPSTCSISGCHTHGRDIHHRDNDPHNNDMSNLIRLCTKHHKYMHQMSILKQVFPSRIVSIVSVGSEEVFDLEVASDNHTFIAGGFAVHNCEIRFEVKLPIFVARQWVR